MYSLFCEAKFWTLKNDVQIRDTDFGALRYYDKKEIDECLYAEGKRSYCHKRGTTLVMRNKRPLKLKDSLKELEQHLSSGKVVFHEWKDNNILSLVLNTGLMIAIGVNSATRDIYKITFDRFLIGKLLSENICGVVATKTHLIISYNENQVTIVNYTKSSSDPALPQKLAKLSPKVQTANLCGPSGRRLDRHLSSNKTGDLILTWWHSTRNEVYPWSPLVKDEDRANVHIYSLEGVKLELLCFHQTEFDLVSVNFSHRKPNLIWLIEQRVSKKGEVVIEYSSHEIVKGLLKKISTTSIPIQTQICCHSISPDEEKLVLGCIDGCVILFDEPKGITRLFKAAFIPNSVCWHSDGAIITIANEKSQFQFFDFALSCLRVQLLNEDVTPSNILDLSSYFKTQPTLVNMKWNKKADASSCLDKYTVNDGLLFLIFDNGPLGVLNLIGGGGLLNDVQNAGLTADTIIRQYLMWNQSDRALNVLLCLNWNTNGSACLSGLYHIANHVFRQPFTPEREIQLEAALGSFYSPIRPLTRAVETEFGNQVHDLTRRFFHHLLRYKLYEKAYCLAIDLRNSDLFIDLYHCAKLLRDDEMAFACRAKFEEFSCLSEYSSHSCCSHSSCSCSDSSSEEDEEDAILPPLPQVSVKKSKASRVPPLPDLNRHSKLRGSAFFNCSSPYLSTDQVSSENLNGFKLPSGLSKYKEFFPSVLNHSTPILDQTYTSPQPVKPVFSPSYEIRTSFSANETNSTTNFTPIEPVPPKFTEYHPPKNVFQPRNGAIHSVYDGIYDNGLPLNIPSVLKDPFQSSPNPLLGQSGPLKLRPLHMARESQFQVSNNAAFAPSNPPPPRHNSFDYLLSGPIVGNHGPFAGGDRSRMGLRPPANPHYYSPMSYGPRNPAMHVPPPKVYDNGGSHMLLQRPLQFVPHPNRVDPNITAKPVVTAAHPKQKVKFSDTVTQILVPDISKMSMEEDVSTSQNNLKNYRNPKSGVTSANFSHVTSCHETVKFPGDFSSRPDQPEDEESNGSIKVIHFGVV